MLLRSLRFIPLLASLIMASAGVAGAQDESDDDYPIEIIARPFTLPQGAVQAGLSVEADKKFDSMAGALQVDYGLIRRLQISASYSMTLLDPEADFSAKGDVAGEANFLFLTGGKLEGMAVVAGGYSLANEGALPLEVGSLFWYTVADSLAVYTQPTLSMALAGQDDGMGNTLKPMAVSVPLSVAVQPIQTVYLDTGVEIAAIEIKDSPTQLVGRDYLSLYLEGYFSPSNKLDFGAGLSWADSFDDGVDGELTLMAVVRARGGI